MTTEKVQANWASIDHRVSRSIDHLNVDGKTKRSLFSRWYSISERVFAYLANTARG